MPRYTVDVSKERLASAGQRRQRTPAVFGNVIASRSYIWIPPVGRPRPVALEIGTPARISEAEWICPFRVSGLPKAIETAAHGSDAVQALELALVGAAALLSRSPQFRAGQIEMWNKPVKNAAELFLPLPMNSLQGEHVQNDGACHPSSSPLHELFGAGSAGARRAWRGRH